MQPKQKQPRTTCNQEVFVEVAKELGLSVVLIKEIFNSHSLFTKRTMEDCTFDGVRWPHFGAFVSKPKEVQIINHLKGLTPEQQVEFKRQVKAGLLRRNHERKQNSGH